MSGSVLHCNYLVHIFKSVIFWVWLRYRNDSSEELFLVWTTALLHPFPVTVYLPSPHPMLMRDMWWKHNAIVCQICLGITAGIWPLCGWTGRSSATDDGLIQSQRADHRKPIHRTVTGRPASLNKPGSVCQGSLLLQIQQDVSSDELIVSIYGRLWWRRTDSKAFHTLANVH